MSIASNGVSGVPKVRLHQAEVEEAAELQRYCDRSVELLWGQVPPTILDQARQLDQELAALGRKTAEVAFNYGRIFFEMRSVLAPVGLFQSWIKARGLDDSTVNRYLNIYSRFKEDPSQIEIFGSSSVLQILAKPSTPLSAIEEARQRAAAGENLTTASVAQIASRHQDGDWTIEQVAQMYAPWGEFKRVASRKFRYALEVPSTSVRTGKTVCFRSLVEAADRHSALCHAANRLDAPPPNHSCWDCTKQDRLVQGYRCGAKGFEFEIGKERDWAKENGGCRHYERIGYGHLAAATSTQAEEAIDRNPEPAPAAQPAPQVILQREATIATPIAKTSKIDWEFRSNIDALLVAWAIEGEIFECCAQDLTLAEQIPGVTTNAIEPEGFSPELELDPTTAATWEAIRSTYSIDWVVSRCDFRVANSVLPHALNTAHVGVALLLDYGALCSGRMEWLNQYGDRLRQQILLNRKAWLVWLKGWSWEGKRLDRPFKF